MVSNIHYLLGTSTLILRSLRISSTVIELMPENVEYLKENGYSPIECDFLKVNTEMVGAKFDKIGANPPFSGNQDIIHIQHMYNEHLAKNGILSSYASRSWINGNNTTQIGFKTWLESLDYDIEYIEGGEFKSSGTNVETVLITIRK